MFSLVHKYVSSILGTYQFIEDFYIVKDYFLVQTQISGSNFFEFAKKSKYNKPVKEVALDNLIFLVNDIHKCGYKIVDISPTNFIYSEDGDLTLIDLELITDVNNSIRRAKTELMVNPDIDLSISTIQQDYFSVCMMSFAILTGKILTIF
ncbi:Uncharacterised protein [Chlamydia trachomatis]|nr:Uncharacterised protein [Chlamydia trachomatis]